MRELSSGSSFFFHWARRESWQCIIEVSRAAARAADSTLRRRLLAGNPVAVDFHPQVPPGVLKLVTSTLALAGVTIDEVEKRRIDYNLKVTVLASWETRSHSGPSRVVHREWLAAETPLWTPYRDISDLPEGITPRIVPLKAIRLPNRALGAVKKQLPLFRVI